MTPARRRLRFILCVLAALAAGGGLSLYALRDNLSYFHAPAQALALRAAGAAAVAPGRIFRLGGLVAAGTVEKGAGLETSFVVTDNRAEVRVVHAGILPDLFREGQGVIATGAFRADGVFAAREILAKHDENYMPPEVRKALEE